jgi:uncharacterized membrane-anchored protein YjiN (DUF445 family)
LSNGSSAENEMLMPDDVLTSTVHGGIPSKSGPSMQDIVRARRLTRIKLVATGLLAISAVIAVVAKLFEDRHWSLGYVAAWASAATVGGLADWYAVVALFKHPCGIPLPHTAIISSNRERIADSFGAFVEEQFLAPEPIEEKLREVDFAALASDWLADERRSASLSRFLLRLLPQALSAVEETGLRSFFTQRVVERLEALEVAPFAAKFLTALVEDERHQRIFDGILTGLNRFLEDEQTLNAIRDKVRSELPSLFRLFRADAYLVHRLVVLISNFIEEARNDQDHALRREFDQFVKAFIENLNSSPEYADRAEALKRELLARPEVSTIADELWQSITSFMENDARAPNSILETQLNRFLADIGTKLAGEPEVRADINRGMMMVLRTFVQNQKREITKFIGNQIKSWDMRQMTLIIELNIGADLQYIRLNGSLIGGLAGLGLYAGEQALRFH